MRTFPYLAIFLGLVALVSADTIRMAFIPAPRYIRSVEFDNRSGRTTNVAATFESGLADHYEVMDGENKVIENTIDRGYWTASDPIVSISTEVNGIVTSIRDPATSIQMRRYTIRPDGTLYRTA